MSTHRAILRIRYFDYGFKMFLSCLPSQHALQISYYNHHPPITYHQSQHHIRLCFTNWQILQSNKLETSLMSDLLRKDKSTVLIAFLKAWNKETLHTSSRRLFLIVWATIKKTIKHRCWSNVFFLEVQLHICGSSFLPFIPKVTMWSRLDWEIVTHLKSPWLMAERNTGYPKF